MMNELAKIDAHSNVNAYRASTEAAALCKEIVVATSSNIQGRRYVTVEGWLAIARAHGAAAGACDVERVDGGIRAIGEVRDILTGSIIARAEGFVGEDEPTWFGGQMRGKTLPKRADYAIRAMAQTRAMSRACRSAFAHVVVMMNAGLATTPAEEVPAGGFDDPPHDAITGEVLDIPAANETRPARTKAPPLDGPYTSKTQLWAAARSLHATLNDIGDGDELEAYLLTKDVEDFMVQCERDAPTLLYGNDANTPPEKMLPEDYEPIAVLIHRLRLDFEGQQAVREQSPLEAG